MYTALIQYGFPRKMIIQYSETYNETPAEREKQLSFYFYYELKLHS